MLKYFESILKRSKLSRQVTIILSAIFATVSVLSCLLFFQLIEPGNTAGIESQALALTKFYSSLYHSISDYCKTTYNLNSNNNSVALLQEIRACSQEMSVRLIAPTALKVTDKKAEENNFFKNYTYKAAMLDSTAKDFKADEFERSIINDFRHTNSDNSTSLLLVHNNGSEPLRG